jgi:hypothetical protein
MDFNKLLMRSLNETVRQINGRFFIFSHKIPGKRLGRKEGYSSKGAAVRNMMMLASHGGFAKNKRKSTVIRNYINRKKGTKTWQT